jgi:hypothetical protein
VTTATVQTCGWCGADLTGKRSHARYCGAPCRAEASRWKHGRSGDAEKAHESADTPPIALIREEHEAAKAHWSMVVDEAIVRHFRRDPTGTFHADDLEPVGIPDDHRNVIGSQIAKWVNRRRMVECGRRASTVPSRNGAKSNEYRLTERGRALVAGQGSDKTPEGAAWPDPAEFPVSPAPITSLSGEPPVGAGQTNGKCDQGGLVSSPAAGTASPDHDPIHAGVLPSSSPYSSENPYA